MAHDAICFSAGAGAAIGSSGVVVGGGGGVAVAEIVVSEVVTEADVLGETDVVFALSSSLEQPTDPKKTKATMARLVNVRFMDRSYWLRFE